MASFSADVDKLDKRLAETVTADDTVFTGAPPQAAPSGKSLPEKLIRVRSTPSRHAAN